MVREFRRVGFRVERVGPWCCTESLPGGEQEPTRSIEWWWGVFVVVGSSASLFRTELLHRVSPWSGAESNLSQCGSDRGSAQSPCREESRSQLAALGSAGWWLSWSFAVPA